MKTFIPKHIDWWYLNINFQIWPFNLNIIQMFIIALWAWFALYAWNYLVKAWVGKIPAAIVATPILLIALFIAFFKVSELTLIPFIFKMIRTYIIDEPIKYQVTYQKIDPLQITLKIIKTSEIQQKIEPKDLVIDKKNINKLNKFVE